MKKNKLGAALGVAIAGATLLSAAAASAQAMASLPRGALPAAVTGEARPVMAWVDLCRRYPQECAIDTAEAPVVALSPRIWQQIVSINRRVNTTITAITDQEHWSVPDRWDLPTDGYGDCEDFQLLKRKLLVEAGVPRRALRVTVVINEQGEGHAVLTVRTEGDDLILDNRTSRLLRWDETGYAFVKRESSLRVGWEFLEPVPTLALVAAVP
jgi:predicted transglutaminase-like cysteine proteinase